MNIEVSSEILNLVPYKPGKPLSEAQREFGITDFVKLASNECPLAPHPNIVKAIAQAAADCHRYPDPSAFELKKAVATYYRVPEAHITFGNGSDELVDLLVRAFCTPHEDSILTSEGAFIAYAISAQVQSVKVVQTPLTSDYKFDLEAMSKILENPQQRPKLVFIPNPNNPTGTYLNSKEVFEFLDRWGQCEDFLIVFDEAYNEFVRASDYPFDLAQSIQKYPNLVVLKTMSKVFALAGARIGSLMADPFVIDIINRIRKPFNVNVFAQAAALQALKETEFLKEIQQITWKGLDYMYESFDEMGIDYIPSQANFILFDTHKDAIKINQELLKEGVILRPVDNYGLPAQLRISVGLPHENEKAMGAIAKVLGLKWSKSKK
ncbi:MAG: histidinol-phosphate transaminase [Bdellovibrionaceae bacterium]|nr:histidinol-phosphate transaminase [Pseudobdellovibrionaceae bacterium]